METETLDLNALMEFDSVVRVTNGTVERAIGIYAPDLQQWEVSGGDWQEEISGEGWTFLNGFSGQYDYSGPMMHSSEYIGGGLAEWIVSHDGYYVAIYPSVTNLDGTEGEADSWAVAYRPLDNA